MSNPAQAVENMNEYELRAVRPEQRAQLMHDIDNSNVPLLDKVYSIALLNATYTPSEQQRLTLASRMQAVIDGASAKLKEIANSFGHANFDMHTSLRWLPKDKLYKAYTAVKDYIAEKFHFTPPALETFSENSDEIARYDTQKDKLGLNEKNVSTWGKLFSAMSHEFVHKWQGEWAKTHSGSGDAAMLNAADRFYGIRRFGYIYYRTNPLESQAFREMNRFNQAFNLPVA